jgi:hypothetical protein
MKAQFMKPSNKRLKLVFIHFLFWFTFAVINHLINYISYGFPPLISDTFVKYVGASLIFYSNASLIAPYFFKKRKMVLFVFALLILCVVSFAVKEILFRILFPLFNNPNGPYTLLESFLMNLWWWMNYGLLGFGFWFAQELIKREREKAILEQERLRLEYAYLKSQINPHFLHNVLNFFYAKSLSGSTEQLSNGILYLADIMRYVINNEEDEYGNIPLESEIQQIQNMIGINQLRFDNQMNIEYRMQGDLSSIKVIPFVLLTLVENAFKHGKILDKHTPLLIELSRDIDSGNLNFLIKNRKANEQSAKSTGLGLENIQKRLALAYGDRHQFIIKEDDEIYSVHLSISL